MRITVFSFLIAGAAVSCGVKTPSDSFTELKKTVNEEFNSEQARREKFNRLADSLYFISGIAYDNTINTIDSIIKNDPLIDNFILAEFNTLKGDIYYEHSNFRLAVFEYSKSGGLYKRLPPRRLIYRAASYIKLNEMDSAYRDIRNSLVNKANFWYLANFFEITKNKDSAIYYYKQLYRYDSAAYDACNKRVIELSKQRPEYYSGLGL